MRDLTGEKKNDSDSLKIQMGGEILREKRKWVEMFSLKPARFRENRKFGNFVYLNLAREKNSKRK